MIEPDGEHRDDVIPGLFTNPILRSYLRNVLDWQSHARFPGFLGSLGLPDHRDNPDNPDIGTDRLFVTPLLTHRHVSPEERPESWLDQADTAFGALEKNKRLVLLGDPGTGKTTLLNQIAWLLSRPTTNPLIERIGWHLPLPMVLRELPIRGVRDFAGLLEAFLTHPMSEPLRNRDGRRYLKQILTEGNAFLLLDGIDEIGDGESRETLREAVLDGLGRSPNCRWLLSSRIVGYDEVPFDGSPQPQNETETEAETETSLRSARMHPSSRKHGDDRVATVRYMAPFDDFRIAIFARHWYTEREAASQHARMKADHLVQAIHADTSILQLARVPSLLIMMALIHRIETTLPHGRALLYERIAEAYLESIDESHGIESSPHDLPRKKGWLARVGFEMQRWRMSTDRMGDTDLLVNSETVLTWLNEQMGRTDPMTHAPSAREFLEIVGRRNGLLLSRGEGRYAFVHLSFQEYFAAVALEREITRPRWARGEKSELEFDRADVARWAGQSVWRETFSFLFELLALHDEDDWHADLLDCVFAKDFSRLDGSEPDEVLLNLAELLGHLVTNPRCAIASHRDKAIECRVRTLLRLESKNSKKSKNTSGMKRRILSSLIGHETELNAEVIEQIGTQTQLKALQSLDLNGIPMSNLEPLVKLKMLRRLDLSGTSISDLGPLAELSAMKEIILRDTSISDLGPLAKLTALEGLDLRDTALPDLGQLTALTTLRRLDISNTPISDLGPLTTMTTLEELALRDTRICELQPLAKLPALEALDLKGTPISDLRPLAGLTTLEMLDISDTRISDLSPLAKLSALKVLDLRGAPISDLEPLTQLTSLATLFLSVPIPNNAIRKLRTSCPKLEIVSF